MLKKSVLNSRGNAMIEIVPILAIFILLVNFALGFFGLIHSGILNSIGARNYAFETLRNRANVAYLRDTTDSDSSFTYKQSGLRFHVVKSELDFSKDSEQFWATRRAIKFSDINSPDNDSNNVSAYHNQNVMLPTNIKSGERAFGGQNGEGVNPGWVRTSYGICLEAKCGG